MTGAMHADEIPIGPTLIHRLVTDQFPQWADAAITPIESAGTDNAIFRLGSDLVVRLPRVPAAVARLAKEHDWLPVLAPHLPVSVPQPVARGEPDHGMPWGWSIYRWLEGEPVAGERLVDPHRLAVDLAGFLDALHSIDPTDGPPPGPHNAGRGVPLADRDQMTRAALGQLDDVIDTGAVARAWEAALAAPRWGRPGVWIHGDVWETNLLVDGSGVLCAVIDFGCLGVGDPACDLSGAWNLFDHVSRESFRRELGVDDATWERGKGWALSFAAVAIPYYLETNPVIVGNALRMIEAVLSDSSDR